MDFFLFDLNSSTVYIYIYLYCIYSYIVYIIILYSYCIYSYVVYIVILYIDKQNGRNKGKVIIIISKQQYYIDLSKKRTETSLDHTHYKCSSI